MTVLGAETKGKNVIAAELKKINEAAAKSSAGFSDGRQHLDRSTIRARPATLRPRASCPVIGAEPRASGRIREDEPKAP